MIDSPSSALSGIFNIDKPKGMTSHDVVAVLRRASGQRRVGHAGTLDPMATGVLVVCLGWATRLVEYLVDGQKSYGATLRLGAVTDTYDAEGTILAETDAAAVSEDEARTVLGEFIGTIRQVPPMFSAIKHRGTPLYRLARRGESVERTARDVRIERLDLKRWSPPDLEVEVVCSKGTYVRSLAHDIGQRLGCGAYLTALTRLGSGPFRLEEAVALEVLVEATRQGRAQGLSYPLDVALDPIEVWMAGSQAVQDLGHGRAIAAPALAKGVPVLAVGPTGEPLALLHYDSARGLWQPSKVFQSPDGEPA